MKSSTLLSGIALLALVGVAHAHAHLKRSIPADASVVSVAPSSVVLTFSEAARLTAAWIQKGDAAKQKLGPLPERPATEVTVALPALQPGTYVVSWRALSDDGHVMPGQIRFAVSESPGAGPTQH